MPESERKKLRALSVRQPWAELILRGDKTIEYRSRRTSVRGLIYIYASRVRYSAPQERQFADEFDLDIHELDALPRGLVLGTVELFDADGGEWLLRNPQRLAEPFKPLAKPQPVWFHPLGRPD